MPEITEKDLEESEFLGEALVHRFRSIDGKLGLALLTGDRDLLALLALSGTGSINPWERIFAEALVTHRSIAIDVERSRLANTVPLPQPENC